MKDGSQPCPLGEKINKTSNIGYLKYPSTWLSLNNKPIVKKEFPKKTLPNQCSSLLTPMYWKK
jgi:hypothetical protein